MGSIFDDHIGDIEQGVSLENDKRKASPSDKPKHNSMENLRAHRLPTGIKGKVDKLIDLLEHKDPELKIEKVDYKIAKELFALIPEYVNAIDSAKLTRSPSVANADLLRDTIAKNAPILHQAVVAELYEHYSELHGVYELCKNDIQCVMSALTTFTEIIKPKLEKLTDGKTLIMIGKDTYDLRTADLDTLKGLNLGSIDYESLRNKLPDIIVKLTTDDLLNLLALVDPNRDTAHGGKIYTYSNVSVLDILSICGAIGNRNNKHIYDFSSFEEIYSLLGNAYCNTSVEIPGYKLEKAYVHYNVVVSALMKFTKLKANIDSEDSVLDAIDKLLDLLGAI